MAPEVPNHSVHHNNGPGFLQSTPQHLPTQNPNHRFIFNGDLQHRPKNDPAMEKFRQVVMKIAEISGASVTPAVAAAEKNLIEQRLTDFFSNFHTPNHPPYAAMIEKAIQELNEKGGSSEESISNYIKREYKDLPWAHSTFLKHHLSKLCEIGEISMTRTCCYLLGCPKPKRENAKGKRKSKSQSQSARGRSRGRKKEETGEQDGQQNGKNYGCTVEGNKPFQEERNEKMENENEPGVEEVSLVEGQNLAVELPNEVFEKENEVNLDISVMDLYPVQIKLQKTELLLPVTGEKLEHVMIQQISEIEPESEPANRLIQGQTEGPAELSGTYNPPESESRLRSSLTLPVNLDSHEKENDEELPNSETELNAKPEDDSKPEKDSETPDTTLNSERGTVESSIGLRTDAKQIDEEEEQNMSSCNKTDRQQRQLKRWRQSLAKVKPPATCMSSQELEQTPMEDDVIQDEGKSLQQIATSVKQTPLVDKDLTNSVIMPSVVELTAVKESSRTLCEITVKDEQPKRQLRSQSHSPTPATLVKHRHPSTPEKSIKLKCVKSNSLSHEQLQEADTSVGQLSHTADVRQSERRWTRSTPEPKQAANSVQTELLTNLEKPKEVKKNRGEQSAPPLTLQRTKLRSWQKENKSQSNACLDLALPSEQLELQTKPDLTKRSADLEQTENSSDASVREPTGTDHQTTPDARDQLASPGRGRGRGRPAMQKPDTSEEVGTDNQNSCAEEKLPHRGRGRPKRGRGKH